MSDRASETVTKVPILGDIPVIGFFFRSKTTDLKKTNIIIAITPYVISDLSDLRRVAEKKMRERREFIERYSSLEDRVSLDKDLDFRRKRGMLEEINKGVRDMEDEERELRQIRERDEGEDSTSIEPVAAKDAPTTAPAPGKPTKGTAPRRTAASLPVTLSPTTSSPASVPAGDISVRPASIPAKE
jgi:hypothetical protein